MRTRRSAIAAGLAALLPRAVGAQTSASAPLVGWMGLASERTDRRIMMGLRQGLEEVGRIEGRTIRLVARHADGVIERMPALIAELDALGVVMFVAAGRAVARELVRVTKKPVVAVRLPAEDGMLFASLARPGGNLTGLSNFAEELDIKRTEILKDLLPGLSTVGLLHAAASPNAFDFGGDAEAGARTLGLTTVRLPIKAPTQDDVKTLVRSFRPDGIRALVVVQDFMTINMRDAIAKVALEEGFATIATDREFAEAGVLISYGADLADLSRRAGIYVDRILKGANPGEMPIQLATKFELVLNLKTANALNLTIPPSILLRADEVIE